MASQLKSKNVFIDTEVFNSYKLRFSHTFLGRLRNLGKLGKLNLLVSEIVVKEVSRHLKAKGLELQKQAKEFSSQTTYFENIVSGEVKSDLDWFADGEICKTLEANWQSYIVDSNIEILKHDDVDLCEVVDRYFNLAPPFGLGKKRKEFPDTISLLALRSWLDENSEYTYVMSRDSDLKKFCEAESRCIHIETLPELLDKYHWDENDQSDLIHELLDQNERHIKHQIKSLIYDSEITFDEGDDWEIENFKILSFKKSSYDVIDSSNESATIYADIELQFSILVSGFDWQNAIRDIDTSDLFPSHFTKRFLVKRTYDILFQMKFTGKSGDQVAITNMTLDEGKGIKFSATNISQILPPEVSIINTEGLFEDQENGDTPN